MQPLQMPLVPLMTKMSKLKIISAPAFTNVAGEVRRKEAFIFVEINYQKNHYKFSEHSISLTKMNKLHGLNAGLKLA